MVWNSEKEKKYQFPRATELHVFDYWTIFEIFSNMYFTSRLTVKIWELLKLYCWGQNKYMVNAWGSGKSGIPKLHLGRHCEACELTSHPGVVLNHGWWRHAIESLFIYAHSHQKAVVGSRRQEQLQEEVIKTHGHFLGFIVS